MITYGDPADRNFAWHNASSDVDDARTPTRWAPAMPPRLKTAAAIATKTSFLQARIR
jgi:hypothetical protein